METPAQRLKFARKLRQLNQIQLAEAAGVATGTVGNIEAGTRGIQGSALKLAKALQVDPQWLANGEGDAPTSTPNADRFDSPRPQSPTTPPASGQSAGVIEVPTLAQALGVLGQVIAASDKLTRAQIKPILDQLLESPEQAAELGSRLEATIAMQQSKAAPLLPGVETKDFIKKKITP